MSSWTDKPQSFNPYVAQLPTEAMVKVGTHKQQLYDQGVEKIQSGIDRVAGLDVTRDVEKNYLQTKLNDLTSNLRGVAAGDFSNAQLTNAVGGMTQRIAGDPIIQTAVNSSMKRKKEMAAMEEASKKGELTPDNESYFLTRDSKWVNSTDLKQGYNAEYVPYFDNFKFAKETFDAIKPDNYSFDEVYQKGADGKYLTDSSGNLILSEAMTRIKEEGFLPEKLQATINQIFSDPRVNKQLEISAEYNYKGTSQEQLVNSVTIVADKTKKAGQDRLEELKLKQQLNPKDEKLAQDIKNTEITLSTIDQNLGETIQQIWDNPDGVKSYLYKSKIMDNYTSMFNFSKKSTESLTSPRWQAKWDQQKEANAQSRWAQTEGRQRQEFKDLYEQRAQFKLMDHNLALEKAKAKNKGTEAGMTQNLLPDPESQAFNDNAFHDSQVSKAADAMLDDNLEFVWGTMFDNNEVNRDKLNVAMKGEYNGQPITRQQAIKNLLTSSAKKKGKSFDEYMIDVTEKSQIIFNSPQGQKLKLSNPALYKSKTDYERSVKNWEVQSTIDKSVNEGSSNSFTEAMDKIDFKETPIVIGNKTFTLTKRDAMDLAIIKKYRDKSLMSKIAGTPEAKTLKKAAQGAEARLNKELLAGFNQVNDRQDSSGNIYPDMEAVKTFLTTGQLGGGIDRNQFASVYAMADKIDGSTLKDSFEKRAQAIRRFRNVEPNLSGSLTTGDDNTDKVILEQISGIANAYNVSEQMTGVDADDVISEIRKAGSYGDLRNLKVQKGLEKDASGELRPFISIGEKKLYLTPTEGSVFGLDPNTIGYDETVISTISLINSNQGQSSLGSIDKNITYRTEAAPLDNDDFPNLRGTKYTVKVHFKQSKGEYFPYVYINDGEREKTVPMPLSDPSLGKLMRETIPAFISPKIVEQLLNK